MTISICDPNPEWPAHFAQLKSAILQAAPAGSVIHHIGSTAIPGLAAKNVIDIQLTVNDLASVNCAAIERQGFIERPGLVDHCPPGLSLPKDDLRKLFFRGTGRRAHLHIRERGRFNQRFALLCRDYLRSHHTAAGAYALIKRRLADRFPENDDAYYDIKDPVFDIIMDGANDWARLVGWSLPSGD